MKSISTHARVTIVVELHCAQPWGADVTMEQVYKQAAEDARAQLMQGLTIDGLKSGPGTKHNAVIVGEPKVTAILVEESR